MILIPLIKPRQVAEPIILCIVLHRLIHHGPLFKLVDLKLILHQRALNNFLLELVLFVYCSLSPLLIVSRGFLFVMLYEEQTRIIGSVDGFLHVV